MELDLNVLSKNQIESTTETNKILLSEDASQMIFKMYIKNICSNPIGSVVREITSNCFDSHVEADIDNTPVLIKKQYDQQTDSHYVSFIDFGVGMSPERIKKVYAVLFESTKRESNKLIGAFGLGSKTPLAYMRQTGEGEGEYDNSFFVITIYSGVKYFYNIFEGTESPEYSLLHKEKTIENNGTEVRVPILTKDIQKFENELRRQLFYFEGIVFEGFSDDINNDYQIIKDKNYLYRPDCFDEFIHVCLGKVYYPINYDVLGLNKYDYKIPIALNIPIGKVGVTVSREQLDYSDETIKYLKNKIETVKSELKDKLTKQYDNVQTLEDYFKFENEFGRLYLTKDHSISLLSFFKKSDITLDNFKYKGWFNKIPDSSSLFNLFFNISVYGKKVNKSWRKDGYPILQSNYGGLKKLFNSEECNVYHTPHKEVSLKRIKQSYLKENHGRFYVLKPNNIAQPNFMRKISEVFNISFSTYDNMISSLEFKEILKMQNEFIDIVQNNSFNYDNVQIPEEFRSSYGRRKISSEILKQTIPVKLDKYNKARIPIKELVNFRGKIFYCSTEDEMLIRSALDLYAELFDVKYLADYYDSYSKTPFKEKGIMFACVAKNNLKYFNYCKNATHINNFYHTFLRRKENEIISRIKNREIVEKYEDIDDFFKSDIFKSIAPDKKKLINDINSFIDVLDLKKKNRYLTKSNWFLKKYINLNNLTETKEEKKFRENIEKLEEIQEKNKDVMMYIKTPSIYNDIISEEKDNEILPNLLKNVLVL